MKLEIDKFSRATIVVAAVISVLVWEIDFGLFASDFARLSVVSAGSFFSSVIRPQPNADAFPRIANLRRPFPPWPLPYSSVQIFPLLPVLLRSIARIAYVDLNLRE